MKWGGGAKQTNQERKAEGKKETRKIIKGIERERNTNKEEKDIDKQQMP